MSNESDDMDLDALISNPFQFLGTEAESPQATQAPPGQAPVPYGQTPSPPIAGSRDTAQADQIAAGMNVDRINKNHPLELRVLSVEKNQLNWDVKVDMLKEIVEHQNERIDLIEKELDLLRKKYDEQVDN